MPQKTSRQRIEQCVGAIPTLVGDQVSMIIRPTLFKVEGVCKHSVSVRERSGRLSEIPMREILAALDHLFRSCRITLHETRVRYSRKYAEFVFGIMARLPGVRICSQSIGLTLVLDL